MISGSLLSAIAATAAAVFAGVNLFISGRREHRQWARQALVESLVAFMNASFDVGRACRQLKARASEQERQKFKQETEAVLHEAQLPILTRLRLLSPPRVANAAHAVHAQDHVRISIALEVSKRQDSVPSDIRETAQEKLREARLSMINEARRALHLRRNAQMPTRDQDPENLALQALEEALRSSRE
jgi:hypothetical protein